MLGDGVVLNEQMMDDGFALEEEMIFGELVF